MNNNLKTVFLKAGGTVTVETKSNPRITRTEPLLMTVGVTVTWDRQGNEKFQLNLTPENQRMNHDDKIEFHSDHTINQKVIEDEGQKVKLWFRKL